MSEPEVKKWFVIVADGKPLGLVLEGTPQYEKARKDYQGLAGIEFYAATPTQMNRFRHTIEAFAEKQRIKREKAKQRRKQRD